MGASAHESQGHAPPSWGQALALLARAETLVVLMGKMPMLRQIQGAN
jgi:hypothetical protein